MKESTRKRYDEKFELILPLIKKGYTRSEACKKLKISRSVFEKLTEEQKRKIDEVTALKSNHDYTQKGRRN